MSTFKRIKKLAKIRGLSLQEVAEKAHIGINTIYKWKNYDPKGTDLAKVANVLHTTTDYLVLLTDDPVDHTYDTHSHQLTWKELGMPYGGYVTKEFKNMVDALAEGYFKSHPELKDKKNE